jgi:polygalacturonase
MRVHNCSDVRPRDAMTIHHWHDASCLEGVETLNETKIALATRDGMPRRDFLRNSMMLAVPMVVGGYALPALAYSPPVRSHGSATRNVKDYGALGNGVHDDTAAFQAAINSLPSSGGTIYVPTGTYMIDAVKSIRLRSYNHLSMSSGAILKAKATSASKYNVIYVYKVHDVEISGGRIIGDRDRHNGTTGEWGHGIFVRGSKRVTVRDVHISRCWGDGVSIGAAVIWEAPDIYSEDVVISNIVATGNRRQGMSIGRSKYVKVYDSEFSNSSGTKPECGIDIEPDSGGSASNIHIENCLIRSNRKYGILIYKNAKYVTLYRNTIERNNSCGVVTVGCYSVKIISNTIRYNGATGIYVQDGTNVCRIASNTSYGNYANLSIINRTDFTLTGWSSKIERDILRKNYSNLTIATNYYK